MMMMMIPHHPSKKWQPIRPAALAFRVRRRSLVRRLVPRDGVALPCSYDRISARKPELSADPFVGAQLRDRIAEI